MRKLLVLVLVGLLISASACVAETPVNPVKWSQTPDMHYGLDYSSETKVPSAVADDFQCLDGNPITDVHFWGSYWATGVAVPPDGSPNSDGFPNGPAGGIEKFVLGFWSDVPRGENMPFSHPGELLWTVDALVYNEMLYGVTDRGANVYQYNVYSTPNEWFLQQQGQIYWLSIEAVLPDTTKQWGWHESKDHWNDDATQIFKGSPWYEIINNTYSVDMAFELTTVPEPSSLAGMAIGAVGLVGWMTRRKRA